MQPGFIRLRAQGNPVVLGRVLPHQDFDSVRGQVAVGLASRKLALLAAVGVLLHIPGAHQLLPDLLQLAFPDALVNVQQHSLEVIRLLQRFIPLLRGDFPG